MMFTNTVRSRSLTSEDRPNIVAAAGASNEFVQRNVIVMGFDTDRYNLRRSRRVLGHIGVS